ncbi:hypothetical protein BDQ12DRAFT_738671 [Crucibulum laeve]|uniref:DUF6699 domain-containing protein n=1 Tax=Crucibulum laeve TaxID=68775 RepID=A0A5C3LKL8_9AGAR|nr:hypothetical protein BDQ12DRAFT_738671 [Crucibulum laeve]
MASYFRSIFGVHSNSTSPTTSSRKDRNDKTHHRSRSAASSPTEIRGLDYFYATPGTASTASSAHSTTRERSNSYVAAKANSPSPLRYTTGESSHSNPTAREHTAPSQQRPSTSHSSRVPLQRTASHQVGERPSPYPLFTPTGSFSSTRSSNSSIYHGSTTSHRQAPPRTSSSGSVATHSEPRPALKQSQTWQAGTKAGPHAHVSFINPNRPTTLHMHPILACTRLTRAPIYYDVTYTPSSHTVLDRHTLGSIPAHTLAQPATEPPTSGVLVMRAERLPWPIEIASTPPKSGKRFYIGDSSSESSLSGSSKPISTLDLLYAIHSFLSTRVTQPEWEALGHGSRGQRKVARAYEKRCTRMGGGWDAGVRRIDFLEGKTRLIGIEMVMEKSSSGTTGTAVGKLAFAKL